MTLSETLQQAVNAWVASKGDPAKEAVVQALLDKPEVKALPYRDRNFPFVTSSKLKELQVCAYHAYLKYVKCEPSPCEPEDYFQIGLAVDDALTHGSDYFNAKYEKVARRSEGGEKVQLSRDTNLYEVTGHEPLRVRPSASEHPRPLPHLP